MNLAVAEGPAVQGIYQQVIREFPDLIGGAGPMWGSKNRRYANRKHNIFCSKLVILQIKLLLYTLKPNTIVNDISGEWEVVKQLKCPKNQVGRKQFMEIGWWW